MESGGPRKAIGCGIGVGGVSQKPPGSAPVMNTCGPSTSGFDFLARANRPILISQQICIIM